MWLRYAYHFLAAIVITVILLLTTLVMDVLFQKTHLTLLLLNIDFLTNPNNISVFTEVLIHLGIGLIIYIVFLILYHASRKIYHLGYWVLVLIFLVMYPVLITIAQRPFFHFSWMEYLWWMVAHIIFIILMAICLPTVAKKHI